MRSEDGPTGAPASDALPHDEADLAVRGPKTVRSAVGTRPGDRKREPAVTNTVRCANGTPYSERPAWRSPSAVDRRLCCVRRRRRRIPAAADAAALLGTAEHGVLGTRWSYDGTPDPVEPVGSIEPAVDRAAGLYGGARWSSHSRVPRLQ
ncbi:maltokinase N-terminal cap-like domain-containing protein [Nocardia sienata]|uniref:maltokinase N-terminal cap-like domain-containing protein n=1 Tax=Nocardia sienata TaxID=248552 RepID=UPI000AF77605|nr:hypothetical protein [Nocardia sienata]